MPVGTWKAHLANHANSNLDSILRVIILWLGIMRAELRKHRGSIATDTHLANCHYTRPSAKAGITFLDL